MNKVLIAPRKYVQGRNVLQEAGGLVGALGQKVMVLWDSNVKSIVGDTLLVSLGQAKLEVVDVDFQGDSTKAEAKRVAQIISAEGADVIV